MFSISTYHLDFGTSVAMEHNVWNISGTQLSYFQLKQKIHDSKIRKEFKFEQK